MLSPHLRRHLFWGKFVAETNVSLPLAAHCLDVALVFRGLSDLPGIRRSLTKAAGEQLDEQQLDRLAVLAMYHDVGKANLGFQRKIFEPHLAHAGHIRELAPLFDLEVCDPQLHSAFLAALPGDIDSWFTDGQNAYSYFMAAFSHHGRPLKFKGEQTGTFTPARDQWWRAHGSVDPMSAVAEITDWARQAFPEAFKPGGQPLPGAAAFHHRFAGLLMLADWLGSHPAWFPVERVTLAARLEHGRKTVPKMLRAVGLDVAGLPQVLAAAGQDFQSRFGRVPRPLQAAVDTLDPHDENTRLIIAESETGSGKTEAALNWFFKLFAAGKVDGLYFALPTRVAARELYGRVNETIIRWFPDEEERPVTVLAVPGYAQVDGLPLSRTLPGESEANLWQDDPELRRRERQWAAEQPKRFLAATVAVGTIDQALLSIVQTAHAHLRSVCLDRNLLVVDEVHASDFYMSRLLEKLLRHHLGVGGRAMLLSATLGSWARHIYVHGYRERFSAPDLDTAVAAPYPSITLADGVVRATGDTASSGKPVRFELSPTAFEPTLIAGRIITALQAGARVLVVMNTVDRANAVLRHLENHPDMDLAWLFRCRDVVCPHHGRFAPADRLILDAQVSRELGAASQGGPVLLVGTQTLEQSLDIDADFMVSDLAPADVLLQRIGRLHRHKRERPPGFETATCLILTPDEDLEEAIDNKGRVQGPCTRLGFGTVYEDLRVLELTRQVLLERPEVDIPRDNRWLVEATTHSERRQALPGERWQLHGQHVEGVDMAGGIAAAYAAASFDEYFGECEFSEAGGRVATRLGLGTLRLKLDKPVVSPFGQELDEIVIPEHMSPKEPDHRVTVEEDQGGVLLLRCGDRRYRYSRYGLEGVTT